MKENIIYVGQGEDHPALFSSGLFVRQEESHWVRPDLQDAIVRTSVRSGDLRCRIRYRQELVGCELMEVVSVDGKQIGYHVVFEFPLKAVTPGQFVAVYFGDEIVFSGVISS